MIMNIMIAAMNPLSSIFLCSPSHAICSKVKVNCLLSVTTDLAAVQCFLDKPNYPDKCWQTKCLSSQKLKLRSLLTQCAGGNKKCPKIVPISSTFVILPMWYYLPRKYYPLELSLDSKQYGSNGIDKTIPMYLSSLCQSCPLLL